MTVNTTQHPTTGIKRTASWLSKSASNAQKVLLIVEFCWLKGWKFLSPRLLLPNFSQTSRSQFSLPEVLVCGIRFSSESSWRLQPLLTDLGWLLSCYLLQKPENKTRLISWGLASHCSITSALRVRSAWLTAHFEAHWLHIRIETSLIEIGWLVVELLHFEVTRETQLLFSRWFSSCVLCFLLSLVAKQGRSQAEIRRYHRKPQTRHKNKATN